MPSTFQCVLCKRIDKQDKGIPYYRVPPGERGIVWLTAIQCDLNTDCTKNKICKRHFDDTSFTEKGALKKEAVPMLTLDGDGLACHSVQSEIGENHSIEGDSQDAVVTGCSSADSSGHSSADEKYYWKWRETQRENVNLQRQVKRLKTANEAKQNPDNAQYFTVGHLETLCDTFCNPTASEVMKAQATNGHYTKELKTVCSKMYLTSNKAYDRIRDIMQLRLPSRTTLCKDMQNIRFESGLNHKILESMQAVLETCPSIYKHCTIAVDEIKLMPHLDYDSSIDKLVGFSDFPNDSAEDSVAEHAMVVLVQGMFVKWTQPLSFWFTKNACKGQDAALIIPDVIRALTKAGFVVHGATSDQGNNFYSLALQLGTTIEQPYFWVDGNKVLYLFDGPHLFKNLRNCLLNGNIFTIDDKIVSWEHIELFYQIDKANGIFREAPKLTDTHMRPVNREKMKVKYATQVISTSVARGINSLIEKGRITASAAGTSEFLMLFDQLFDILNSSSESHEYKLMAGAYRGADHQIDFLQSMLAYMEKMRIVGKNGEDRSNEFRFLKGLKRSVHGLMQIWENVRQIEGVTHLCTRYLNQDALENFFGRIRSACGDNRTPTCKQFGEHFKRQACTLLFEHSNGANCEDDGRHLLLFAILNQPLASETATVADDDVDDENEHVTPKVSEKK